MAVAALASFPLIERRRRQPMFDLALLRKPTFVGGLAGALALALIRGKDFHDAHGAAAEADTPVASTSRP